MYSLNIRQSSEGSEIQRHMARRLGLLIIKYITDRLGGRSKLLEEHYLVSYTVLPLTSQLKVVRFSVILPDAYSHRV